MTRTQVQLPDPLYKDLKRIAKQHDWSLAEVIRRGGELMVARYPESRESNWQLPEALNVGGDFLRPPETFEGEAEAIESKVVS